MPTEYICAFCIVLRTEMAKKGYTIINFSLDTDRGNPAGGRAQNVLTDFQVTELGFVAV